MEKKCFDNDSVTLSRRGFIKSAGVLAAACTVTGNTLNVYAAKSPASDMAMSNVEVINTHHRIHCHGSCMLKAYVKNGTLLHLTSMGDIPREGSQEKDEAILAHQRRACPRGLAEKYRLYSPDRLKYPMKQTLERGNINGFKRFSWQEAAETIAKWLNEMKEYEKTLGYLPIWAMGDSPARYMGTTLDTYGHHSAGNQMDAMFVAIGANVQGNPAVDILNSKLIIIWSTDTKSTQPQHSFLLMKAKEAGIPIVVVDTRYTDTAATYGTGIGKVPAWIAVRPGTDAALQSAMAYVIYKKKLHNEAFIKENCFGFYPNDKIISNSSGKDPISGEEFKGKTFETPKGQSFVEYLEGLEKTHKNYKGVLAWASNLTGVPAETIEAFALAYAKAPASAFFCGWTTGGAQRTGGGMYYSWLLIALSAMTGNITKRGGGFGMVCPHDGYKLKIKGEAPMTDMKRAKPITFSAYFSSDVILNGRDARTADELKSDVAAMNKIDLGSDPRLQIKMIYRGAGSNDVFNQRGGINKKLEAWKSVKYIVSYEFHMSSTARFSDIVLPAAMNLEQTFFTNGQMNSELDVAAKVSDTLSECKPDWEINKLIGAAVGMQFDRKSDIEVMKAQWSAVELPEKYKAINPDVTVPSFEQMLQDGQFRLPTPLDKTFVDMANRKTGELATETGRINFFSPYLASRGRVVSNICRAQYVRPYEGYEDVLEGKKSAKGNSYKLQFITPHVIQRAHSSFDSVPLLRDTFSNSVEIHPSDAEKRKIKDGDTVYVYNDSGCVKLSARVTKRIMPGVIAVYEGAWYTPDSSETYQAVTGVSKDGKPKLTAVPVDIGASVATITEDINCGAADPFTSSVTNKSGGFAAGGMLCEISTQKPL